MKDHKDCFRGYHRNSKAWYAKEEVVFGIYHPDGECMNSKIYEL